MEPTQALFKQSIQERATASPEETSNVFAWLVASDALIPPWWSKARDHALRQWWMQSDYISGAVYVMIAKLTALTWKIEPLDPTIASHRKLADEITYQLVANSDFGAGWNSAMSRFLLDYFTTDCGGFLEIYGAGRPSGPIKGLPVGIAHLDSYRITRTGSPEYPATYQDTNGESYKLHRSRIMLASSLPSSIVEMHSVGYCACSRCIQVAGNLNDMLLYEQERFGSRPPSRVILGKGISGAQIKQAFSTAEEEMNAQGLRRFAKSVAMGSTRTDVDLSVVPLTGAPESFDRRNSTDLAMFTIALAFGVAPRDLWPATTVGATKADALVQAMRARGTGPGQIILQIEHLFNSLFLPPTLRFRYDLQDDEEDQLQASVRGARMGRHVQELQTGVLNQRAVRLQMLSDGDLTDGQFRELELVDGRLEDGADVITLFFTPEPAVQELLHLEGCPEPFAIPDPVLARRVIEQAILRVQAGMMRSRATARWEYREALAALSALQNKYTTPQAETQAKDIPTSAQEEGAPGLTSVEGVTRAEPAEEMDETGGKGQEAGDKGPETGNGTHEVAASTQSMPSALTAAAASGSPREPSPGSHGSPLAPGAKALAPWAWAEPTGLALWSTYSTGLEIAAPSMEELTAAWEAAGSPVTDGWSDLAEDVIALGQDLWNTNSTGQDLEAGVKDQGSFTRSIRRAVRLLWSQKTPRVGFVENLRAALDRAYRQAWTDGAKQAGIEPEELTDAEWSRLAAEQAKDMSYVDGFAQTIEAVAQKGGGIDPLLARAGLWAQRFKTLKSLSMMLAGHDQKMLWKRDPTKASCPTCIFLDGKIYRASTWQKADLYPGCKDLGCGGFHCGCDWQPTTARVTSGGTPLRLAPRKQG